MRIPFILTYIALAFLHAQGLDRWTVRNPLPSAYGVGSAVMFDGGSAIGAGSYGRIIATEDGGKTWADRPSGTRVHLHRLVFASRLIGYAAGDSGVLLRTLDGGWTWTSLVLPTRDNLVDLDCAGQDSVFVLTGKSALLVSGNSGGAWQAVPLPRKHGVVGLDFLDGKRGHLVGYEMVFRTSDGGATWDSVQAGDGYARLIKFKNVQNGLIGSIGGRFYKTTDGGKTWESRTMYSAFHIQCIHYAADGSVHARDDRANNLRSVDGGENWEIVSSGTGGCVEFSSGPTVIAIGPRGRFTRSDDGARTWSDAAAPFDEFLFAVHFASRDTVFAAGSTVLRSTDGGRTWEVRGRLFGTLYFEALHFFNGQEGIGGGGSYNDGILKKTVDGGATWTDVLDSPVSHVIEIKFPVPDTGYAATRDGTFLGTTDRGKTWTRRAGVGLASFHFRDSRNGLGVNGSGKSFLTSDAGLTWQSESQASTRPLTCVMAADDQVAYAAGWDGTLIKSVDGGLSWKLLPVPTTQYFQDIHVAGRDTVIVAGLGGVLLKSADGGATWEQQNIDTHHRLEDFHFLDSRTAIVVGEYGGIYSLERDPVGLISGNRILSRQAFYRKQGGWWFDLESAGPVSALIVDARGRLQSRLFKGYRPAGSYPVSGLASQLPPGPAYLVLKASGRTRSLHLRP